MRPHNLTRAPPSAGVKAARFAAVGITELLDEAGHLSPGEASDLLQIAPDETLVGFAQTAVLEAAQFVYDPVVGVLASRRIDAEGLGAFQESTNLLQRLKPLVLSVTIIFR